MSGFQVGSFQAGSFQQGYDLVASNYSIGSPSIGTPALGQVLSAANYSIGSPSLGTPLLRLTTLLHANAYSIGSPIIGTPTLRQTQRLYANGLTLPAPVSGVPTLTQTHRLSVPPVMEIGSPDLGRPILRVIHQLSASNYSLGSPVFSPAGPITIVGHILIADNYSIGSPKIGVPRLQVIEVPPDWPPLYLDRIQNASDILNGLLNNLLGSVPGPDTSDRFKLQGLVGQLRSDADTVIRGGTLGDRLQECFDAAYVAKVTFDGLEQLRNYLKRQPTKEDFSRIVVQSGILMTIALEAKVIVSMTFKSRDAISSMIDRSRSIFDDMKSLALDELDEAVYQNFNALARSVLFYLADAELQLPRVVTYRASDGYPALYLAQRIYADASRYEEIVDENKIVNPAFCPPGNLKVLSD